MFVLADQSIAIEIHPVTGAQGAIAIDIDESDRRKVLVTGLRALDGRNDLECF